MAEQKKQRTPWQSYFWSALISAVFLGGYTFFAWGWQGGRWVWIRVPSRDASADRYVGNVLSSLRANDFARVTAQFDSTMNEAFPPKKLETDWVQLTTQFGALQSWKPVERLHHPGREVGTYLLQFEHGQVKTTVTFDPNFPRISGLCFEPLP